MKSQVFKHFKIFGLIFTFALLFGLTSPSVTAHADDKGIFDKVMKDMSWEPDKAQKQGIDHDGFNATGSYWSRVNGTQNGFLGLTTGTSYSFMYVNPSSLPTSGKKSSTQQRSTAASAAYMYQLDRLGLDHSWSGGFVSNAINYAGRMIGGFFLVIPLLISMAVGRLFDSIIQIADSLNFLKFLGGTKPDGSIGAGIYDVLSPVYKALQALGFVGFVVIVGFTIGLTMLGVKKYQRQSAAGTHGNIFAQAMLRMFIMFAGPLIIGVSFSAALDGMKGAYNTTSSNGTVLYSYMVDFQGWTKHTRLGLTPEINSKIPLNVNSNVTYLTKKQVLDINKNGAYDKVTKNPMGFLLDWSTSNTYDAGQYASYFQTQAKSDYFTSDNRKKLKEWNKKESYALTYSGSIKASSMAKDATFTEGVATTKNLDLKANEFGLANKSGYGLSTIGMYNYLATTSSGSALTWTRISSLQNDVSKPTHASVGLTGRGFKAILNFMQLFALLAATAFLGLVFALSAWKAVVYGFLNTILRSFTSVAGGSAIQFAKLLSDFVAMVANLYGSAFLYIIAIKVINNFNDSDLLTKATSSSIINVSGANAVTDMGIQFIQTIVTLVLVLLFSKYRAQMVKSITEMTSGVIDKIFAGMGHQSNTAKNAGNSGGFAGGAGHEGEGGSALGGLGKMIDAAKDGQAPVLDADGNPITGVKGFAAKHGRNAANMAHGTAMRALRDSGHGGLADDLDKMKSDKKDAKEAAREARAKELNPENDDKAAPSKEGDSKSVDEKYEDTSADVDSPSVDDEFDDAVANAQTSEESLISDSVDTGSDSGSEEDTAKAVASANNVVNGKNGSSETNAKYADAMHTESGVEKPKNAEEANSRVNAAKALNANYAKKAAEASQRGDNKTAVKYNNLLAANAEASKIAQHDAHQLVDSSNTVPQSKVNLAVDNLALANDAVQSAQESGGDVAAAVSQQQEAQMEAVRAGVPLEQVLNNVGDRQALMEDGSADAQKVVSAQDAVTKAMISGTPKEVQQAKQNLSNVQKEVASKGSVSSKAVAGSSANQLSMKNPTGNNRAKAGVANLATSAKMATAISKARTEYQNAPASQKATKMTALRNVQQSAISQGVPSQVVHSQQAASAVMSKYSTASREASNGQIGTTSMVKKLNASGKSHSSMVANMKPQEVMAVASSINSGTTKATPEVRKTIMRRAESIATQSQSASSVSTSKPISVAQTKAFAEKSQKVATMLQEASNPSTPPARKQQLRTQAQKQMSSLRRNMVNSGMSSKDAQIMSSNSHAGSEMRKQVYSEYKRTAVNARTGVAGKSAYGSGMDLQRKLVSHVGQSGAEIRGGSIVMGGKAQSIDTFMQSDKGQNILSKLQGVVDDKKATQVLESSGIHVSEQSSKDILSTLSKF